MNARLADTNLRGELCRRSVKQRSRLRTHGGRLADTNVCNHCGRKYTPRPRGYASRFCSDAHRVAAKRIRKANPLAALLASARALLLCGAPLSPEILRALDEALPLRQKHDQRKPRTEHLAWPRRAEDGTPLGVDLSRRRPLDSLRPDERAPTASAYEELRALILGGGFRVPGFESDDIIQAVALVIARRNHMPSAFDPRKSSYGHYVHLVAKTTCMNIAASRQVGDELTAEGDVDVTAEDVSASLFLRREGLEALMELDPEEARVLLEAIDRAVRAHITRKPEPSRIRSRP